MLLFALMNWITGNAALLIEWTGALMGIGYIFFATRNSQWCWPLGIISSIMSIWLFYTYSQLYSEAILSFYYVVMGFYGWWHWHEQDEQKNREGGAIHRMRNWEHLAVIGVGILLALGLYYSIDAFCKDAHKPMLDAFTTIFSFLATWLTARRVIENWVYWIVIDSVSVFLYLSRDLYIYAGLMAIYTLIAFYGYFNWKKKMIQA